MDNPSASSTNENKRGHRALILTLLGISFCAAGAWVVISRIGTTVTIQNTGDTNIESLLVRIRGTDTRIQRLAPQAKVSFRVHPRGESHADLAISARPGEEEWYCIDCYLEAGGANALTILVAPDEPPQVIVRSGLFSVRKRPTRVSRVMKPCRHLM